MGDLSRNFSRREFACTGFTKGTGCGCRGFVAVDLALVNALQNLREASGYPVRINSGYRCERRNIQAGGTGESRHVMGFAADIIVGYEGREPPVGWSPREVAEWFRRHYPEAGIGEYAGFTHVDFDPLGKGRRWHG